MYGEKKRETSLFLSAGTDFRDPVLPHAEAFLTMKTTKVNWVKK